MIISHTREITRDVRDDGNIDAVNVKIPSTGSSGDVAQDRYRHTIIHGLNREPVGCMVIYATDYVQMKIIDNDKNKIIVQFDTAEVEVNLRIW
jgi:hypothetical protein